MIVARDANIRLHKADIDAVIDNGARLVALAGQDATNNWNQLDLVMTRWRDIEKLAGLPGPFAYAAYRTALTRIA